MPLLSVPDLRLCIARLTLLLADLPYLRVLDFLALGLRLREGVVLDAFRERFGLDALALLGDTGAWLVETGVLCVQDGRLSLDAERQFVINEVLVRIDQAVRDTSSSHIAAR